MERAVSADSLGHRPVQEDELPSGAVSDNCLHVPLRNTARNQYLVRDVVARNSRNRPKHPLSFAPCKRSVWTILYEDGENGWVVSSIPAVPGALSQGRTREEARENILDALALMLSSAPVAEGDRRERELLHLIVS